MDKTPVFCPSADSQDAVHRGGNPRGVELKNRQRLFVNALLSGCTGKEAAVRAGYSPASAESQASRLLRNAKVKAALEAGKAKATELAEATAADILRELGRIALADPAQAFDADGNLLPLHKMPVEIRRAISGIDVEEITVGGESIGQLRKVKFWDKTKGLELLGKHHELYTDKVKHSGKVTLEQLVMASMEKPPEGGT